MGKAKAPRRKVDRGNPRDKLPKRMTKPVQSWTTLAKANEHDARARELDREYKNLWVELSEIAIAVRDQKEWQILGYHSYNSWLLSACPCSRSLVYMAVGAREKLNDIPRTDLLEICLSNAIILKSLPKSLRTIPETLEAAKAPTPREFISKAIAASPDSHLEPIVTLRIKLTLSQYKTWEIAKDVVSILEGEVSDATVLEAIAADYILGHQEELERRET